MGTYRRSRLLCMLRSGTTESHNNYILYDCVWASGYLTYCTSGSQGQLSEFGNFRPNSNHQIWWQVPLSTEPFYRSVVHNEFIMSFLYRYIIHFIHFHISHFFLLSPAHSHLFFNLCFGVILCVWPSKFHHSCFHEHGRGYSQKHMQLNSGCINWRKCQILLQQFKHIDLQERVGS